MAQYILLFVGRQSAPDATDPETAEYNQKWVEYMAGLAQSGQLRAGAPFEPNGRVVARNGVTDLELEELDIGGYVLVEADSLETAERIASEAPHIALGGTTVVRPCIPVP
jgi:hypothetical protein